MKPETLQRSLLIHYSLSLKDGLRKASKQSKRRGQIRYHLTPPGCSNSQGHAQADTMSCVHTSSKVGMFYILEWGPVSVKPLSLDLPFRQWDFHLLTREHRNPFRKLFAARDALRSTSRHISQNQPKGALPNPSVRINSYFFTMLCNWLARHQTFPAVSLRDTDYEGSQAVAG